MSRAKPIKRRSRLERIRRNPNISSKVSEVFVDQLCAQYGTTTNLKHACYLMPDGTLLDCHDDPRDILYDRSFPRKTHATIACRSLEDLRALFGEVFDFPVWRSDYMRLFMEITGAIRIGFNGDLYLIEIIQRPTWEQVNRIKRILEELQRRFGRVRIEFEQSQQGACRDNDEYGVWDDHLLIARILRYWNLH